MGINTTDELFLKKYDYILRAFNASSGTKLIGAAKKEFIDAQRIEEADDITLSPFKEVVGFYRIPYSDSLKFLMGDSDVLCVVESPAYTSKYKVTLDHEFKLYRTKLGVFTRLRLLFLNWWEGV